MPEPGKKIKEEFGLQEEAQAVQEYSALINAVMYPNYPLIADEVLSRLQTTPERILDIGTGLGTLATEFAKRLPRAQMIGVDLSMEMLQEAQRKASGQYAHLKFIACDVHKPCLKIESFDLVVSFGVLHHLHDLEVVLTGVRSLMGPGGVAYIYDLKKEAHPDTVSEIALGLSPLHRKAFLESVDESFSEDRLRNALAHAGFSAYSLSSLKFSRSTLVKNKEMLRQSSFLGERFSSILWECCLKK
ncbi:MAG: class I SAM-dependent methyltransferase [Candidatus Omnitrophota bacterium]